MYAIINARMQAYTFWTIFTLHIKQTKQINWIRETLEGCIPKFVPEALWVEKPLILVKQGWDNTFLAAVTLQVGLTFQGEAGFPQLHSWRPEVFQGKSTSGRTPAGEARCVRPQTEAERALELGETRRRASRVWHTYRHTLMEKCAFALTHASTQE